MTLQEYLIQLGFRVDEPSLKKFIGVVSAVGSATAEAGTAAIETATAIELMVSRVARTYETLYYMSVRTNQSVRYIQATQFAFKQIGLSADDANASIEGIASTLRTQPWLRALFGGATTPQQIAQRLGQSGLPYFLQARFAEMIGMDEKTLFHLQKFAQVEADTQADLVRRQQEAGINVDEHDPNSLTSKSVVFARALNKLESDLELFGDRMAVDFIDPVTKGVGVVDEFIQRLNRLDAATKGWLGTLEGLVGTTGGLFVLERILSKLLFKGGTGPIGGLANAIAGAVGAKAAGGFVGRGLGAIFGGAAGYITGPLGWLLASTEPAGESDAAEAARRNNQGTSYNLGGPSLETGIPSRGDRNNNPGNIKYGPFAIAHGAIGSDGTFAVFPSKSAGEAAMAALLHSNYSGLSLAQIQQKWVGNADVNYLRAMMTATNLQASAVPNLDNPQTMADLIQGMARGEGSHVGYDRLSGLTAQHHTSSTKNVTLHQQTVIHASGPDPKTTAKTVAKSQDEINNTAVRNLSAVTR